MPKSILLLDDSEIVRAAAVHCLEAAGYRVTAVSSIDELEEVGAPGKADLILLDVEVAQLFGDDVGMVLRKVRGITQPIWLYSSKPEAELAERVADAGLDGFISKSDGLDVLVERVRTILGDPD
ncbi:MAG TPA: response regulator [Kofleriaceae bacterium]|nr:response regulator [Kofleriaceae bacterium]